MSQSSLFKKIASEKIQNKYAFILYKQKYNDPNKYTPLKICHNHHEVSYFILQCYINELCKTKTVISPSLLKILNSKKSIRTKINAIVLEYKNLFPNNSFLKKYYNINEFNFRLVKNDNMIYHKILRKQLKTSNYNIQFTLTDYNTFYNYITNNIF